MKRAYKIMVPVFIAFMGCNGNKDFPPDSYVSHMEHESNQFRRKFESGSVSYTIQLATPEYIACKERTKSSTDISPSRLNELQEHIFFIIRIEEQKKADLSDPVPGAEEKAGYYQFQAMGDLALAVDSLRLPPVMYHYENNYGLSPYNTIIVGFKNIPDKSIQLIFHDRYNGNPFIKTAYSKEELARLPKLKTI